MVFDHMAVKTAYFTLGNLGKYGGQGTVPVHHICHCIYLFASNVIKG